MEPGFGFGDILEDVLELRNVYYREMNMHLGIVDACKNGETYTGEMCI